MTTIVTHAQAERIRAAFTALGVAASEAVHHYHVAVADMDPAIMERIRLQVAAWPAFQAETLRTIARGRSTPPT